MDLRQIEMQVLAKKIRIPVQDQRRLARRDEVREAWMNTKVVEISKEERHTVACTLEAVR